MKAKLWLVCILVLAAGAAAYGAWHLLGDRGRTAVAGACAAHGIQRCPFCSPALLESMGFCREHGVPEAICTRCRGDLEAAFRAAGDWCAGHGLPESQCEACNRGVLDKYRKYDRTSAPTTRGAADITVVPAGTPRIHREPSLACAVEDSVVRFASAAVAARAGLTYCEVRRVPLRRTVAAPAELEYDARRRALLAPRAPGSVVEVRKELGDRVAEGDVMVVVRCASLGTAKSELLQAAARVQLGEKSLERARLLLGSSLATEQDVLETELRLTESRIALAVAEQGLRNLGLDDAQIHKVREAKDISGLLQLVAPFPGVVVAQHAVIGQIADPAAPLVGIADPVRMWVMADVDPADIAAVAVGQRVLVTLDGLRGETFGGRVTWVSTELDPRTRTIKVRAEVDNTAGRLRARSFGRVRIVTRDGEEALLVAKDAVQWEGCCNVAFVRRSDTEFLPRKLRLGYDTGEFYEVLTGLAAGEEVVTQGSYLLRTELQKGSIGAGCCDVGHLGK